MLVAGIRKCKCRIPYWLWTHHHTGLHDCCNTASCCQCLLIEMIFATAFLSKKRCGHYHASSGWFLFLPVSDIPYYMYLPHSCITVSSCTVGSSCMGMLKASAGEARPVAARASVDVCLVCHKPYLLPLRYCCPAGDRAVRFRDIMVRIGREGRQ